MTVMTLLVHQRAFTIQGEPTIPRIDNLAVRGGQLKIPGSLDRKVGFHPRYPNRALVKSGPGDGARHAHGILPSALGPSGSAASKDTDLPL